MFYGIFPTFGPTYTQSTIICVMSQWGSKWGQCIQWTPRLESMELHREDFVENVEYTCIDLSMDGVDPFGRQQTTHSTRPNRSCPLLSKWIDSNPSQTHAIIFSISTKIFMVLINKFHVSHLGVYLLSALTLSLSS